MKNINIAGFIDEFDEGSIVAQYDQLLADARNDLVKSQAWLLFTVNPDGSFTEYASTGLHAVPLEAWIGFCLEAGMRVAANLATASEQFERRDADSDSDGESV